MSLQLAKNIIKQYSEFDISTAKPLAINKAMKIENEIERKEVLNYINQKYSNKSNKKNKEEMEEEEEFKPQSEWTIEEIQEYNIVKNKKFSINYEEEFKKYELYQYDENDNVITDTEGKPILKQIEQTEQKKINETNKLLRKKIEIEYEPDSESESKMDTDDEQYTEYESEHNNEKNSISDRINNLEKDINNSYSELKDFKDIFNTENLEKQTNNINAFQVGIKGSNWQLLKLEDEKNKLNILLYQAQRKIDELEKCNIETKIKYKKLHDENKKYKEFFDKYNNNDEVENFINNNYIITNNPKNKIITTEVYQKYRLIDSNKIISDIEFNKRLKLLGINKSKINGYNYYKCIQHKN